MIRFSSLALCALLFSSAIAPAGFTQENAPIAPPPLAGGAEDQDSLGERSGDLLENPFAYDGDMTPERLELLVKRVDPRAQKMGNGYVFKVEERPLRIVYDEQADRMRIITPIIPARDLPDGLLNRMLQANFDSVLDSRYAIGGGNVWSVFIHRLSSLTDEDLISGISQTAVAAETFGTTFSSGAVVFGGGDSSEINERLIERLRESIENGEDDRGI